MKRPEGFDPGPRVEPEPASRRSRPPRAPRPKAPAAVRVETPAPRAKPRKSAEPDPAVSTGAEQRSASRAVAKAARERRRFERRERKRFTRRSRHRRMVWVTLVGTAAVLAVLLAVATFSPLLSVRTIEVRGTDRLDAAAVEEALGSQLGVPLALIDSELIRTTLAEYPIIRSFAVELVPPSTMVVAIVERQPVGVVVEDGAFQVVDPAGVRLSTSATRPDGLPMIESTSEERGFDAVVEVLLALPVDIRDRVELATAATRDDVQLLLRGSGAMVVWGSAEESALKARVLENLMKAQGNTARVVYDVSAPLVPVVRKR